MFVFLSRSWRLVSFFSFCVVVAAFTIEVSDQEVGGDGFETQKRKSWIPGQVRAEKVLADAIRIDGRKEWICKFLFRVECVDAVATQTMPLRHPCRTTREVQTGSVGEKQRVVFRMVFLEWWRREKAPRSGGGDFLSCVHRWNSSENSRK